MEQNQSRQNNQEGTVSTQPGQGFNTIQPAGITFTPAHVDDNPNMARPDPTPTTMQQPEAEALPPDPAAPSNEDQRSAVPATPPATIGRVQGMDIAGRATTYAILDDGTVRPE